jgi:hypothetical protein
MHVDTGPEVDVEKHDTLRRSSCAAEDHMIVSQKHLRIMP